jgi:NADPH:quinone reductase-like Zn-dependent oxidoreductase
MADFRSPDEMSAVVLEAFGGVSALVVKKLPVPTPGPNQVLVKIASSPINPSDLAFIDGTYDGAPPGLPTVAGFEASGTVVASGKGIMGTYLSGKNVACARIGDGDGMWSEYALVPVRLALPLSKGVDLERGSMAVVNPLTALAFLEIAKSGGHTAIVNTAAAGALGQMVNRLFTANNVRVINIVRRPQQADLLRERGVAIVLDSSDSSFDGRLREECERHGAKLAFDAIAGANTLRLLTAMPDCSSVVVYGALSLEPSLADPGDLIFHNKSVTGFWLTSFLAKKSALQSMRMWRRVQSGMLDDFTSHVRARYSLDQVVEAIESYQSDMSAGKVLLTPGP